MSFLANEFDVLNVLHWQVTFAAVNQIYVIHEAMNGCKKKSTCFENINVCLYLQAAEKSFKAAMFSKNANDMKWSVRSHNLCFLAQGLSTMLGDLAQELSDLVGEHTKMRLVKLPCV